MYMKINMAIKIIGLYKKNIIDIRSVNGVSLNGELNVNSINLHIEKRKLLHLNYIRQFSFAIEAVLLIVVHLFIHSFIQAKHYNQSQWMQTQWLSLWVHRKISILKSFLVTTIYRFYIKFHCDTTTIHRFFLLL